MFQSQYCVGIKLFHTNMRNKQSTRKKQAQDTVQFTYIPIIHINIVSTLKVHFTNHNNRTIFKTHR